MPIYVYKATDVKKACEYCKNGFDILQEMDEKPLAQCPKCGAPVEKTIARFSTGFSQTGFDSKAKEKGFHKLKRKDKGTFEKEY